MIALLPVSRFRIDYQVAAGRPYSAFERLLLEAIVDGKSGLDDLCAAFCVHRRVVIEGLVTLMQAGWVALDANTNGFRATKAGQAAIKGDESLPPNVVVASRVEHVVMERVHGQVARSVDVSFVSRGRLRKRGLYERAAVLPKGMIANSVEPAMVQGLLRPAPGEWLKWIGPITIVRDNVDFLPVEVDTRNKRVIGLPKEWEALLEAPLMERVRRKESDMESRGELPEDPTVLTWIRERRKPASVSTSADEWFGTLTASDVIVGSAAHLEVLRDRLGHAKSYVIIVSPSLANSRIVSLVEALTSAVQRGVLVEILWGASPLPANVSDHEAALRLLRKIEYDSARAAGPGRLVVARQPSESHASVVLSDSDDAVAAIVGSATWLGGDEAQEEASVRLDHPLPVARLCRIVADLAAADDKLSTGAGAVRLRNASAALEARLALGQPLGTSAASVRMRLVTDRDHYTVLRGIASEARSNIAISSRHWGSWAQQITIPLLVSAIERGCLAEIRYDESAAQSETVAGDAMPFLKVGGTLRPRSALHANYVVADDNMAVVSSFNWLSGERSTRRPHGAEIGVVLTGEGVAEHVAPLLRLT